MGYVDVFRQVKASLPPPSQHIFVFGVLVFFAQRPNPPSARSSFCAVDRSCDLACRRCGTAGRVFTEEELRKVGEFCERHDLTIVSDEIHSDLILDEGLKHISMLALDNGVRVVAFFFCGSGSATRAVF